MQKKLIFEKKIVFQKKTESHVFESRIRYSFTLPRLPGGFFGHAVAGSGAAPNSEAPGNLTVRLFLFLKVFDFFLMFRAGVVKNKPAKIEAGSASGRRFL